MNKQKQASRSGRTIKPLIDIKAANKVFDTIDNMQRVYPNAVLIDRISKQIANEITPPEGLGHIHEEIAQHMARSIINGCIHVPHIYDFENKQLVKSTPKRKQIDTTTQVAAKKIRIVDQPPVVAKTIPVAAKTTPVAATKTKIVGKAPVAARKTKIVVRPPVAAKKIVATVPVRHDVATITPIDEIPIKINHRMDILMGVVPDEFQKKIDDRIESLIRDLEQTESNTSSNAVQDDFIRSLVEEKPKSKPMTVNEFVQQFFNQ